jgi:4-hydroxy-3-methylbut-2-enyl diphosphate reductase
MGRKFNIPVLYRSSAVASLKEARRVVDQRKQDFTPSIVDLGAVRFKVARHFGFCFGVQNAIEIAYRALDENPGRRVFLLSEMIHNPHVNSDLLSRGVRFIMSTDGDQLIPFAELERDDIVIVPAFGTTVELFDTLRARGIDPLQYNATCPFVEKVWKRSHQLGERGYTVVIHGKHTHEETRATFSHAQERAPSLVIRDMPEALRLAEFLRGERDLKEFAAVFAGRYTPGFEPTRDLVRIGVVNQTTMLASETEAISDVLRGAMLDRFGRAEDDFHFADTRDTLCYATSENQTSVFGLLEAGGDLAIVVGGYNSSNTSHLAEILAERLPTYYIKDAAEMVSAEVMRHLDVASGRVVETKGWMPTGRATVDILLSAGASCPDTVVDGVITRLAALYGVESRLDGAIRAATAVTR